MRNIWCSEQEICELLLPKLHEFFKPNPSDSIYCEADFGVIRPDFLYVEPRLSRVTIIEVKITASDHAIAQICRYRNYIQNQYRLWAYKNGIAEPSLDLTITMAIIARWFDRHIYEVATALDINLMRVTPLGTNTITLDHEFDDRQGEPLSTFSDQIFDTFLGEKHG